MLVIAATPIELAFIEGAETLCCGVGPVEAALRTAHRLANDPPELILHVGIAGARTLAPATLVLGTEAVYCDIAASARAFPGIDRATPDASMLAVARAALPDAQALPIATTARVGGGWNYDVEAMEGFAVLRAAAASGIPALELRAISNAYDDDRESWRIDEAIAALARGVTILTGMFDAP